jgi:hypothetical protein
MESSRRSFLLNTIAGTAGATMIPGFVKADPVLPKPRIKLSISSYSYWHFKGEKFPIEKVIDEAAKTGVEGIDILHRQMESEDNTYRILNIDGKSTSSFDIRCSIFDIKGRTHPIPCKPEILNQELLIKIL